jgi:hypothetical protein
MRIKWIRALPDTYLINFVQLSHMTVLAGVAPWQIGMTSYGLFAATIALPSIAQSFFETFCLMSVYKYGRLDVIVRPIAAVVIPLLIAFAVSFIILLDWHIAVLAIVLTVGLFFKSLMFALVVSRGVGVVVLAKSELITLAAYVASLFVLLVADVRDAVVPMVMVSTACFASAAYIVRFMSKSGMLTPGMFLREDSPRISFSSAGRIIASRSYEEGVLTLSPLILAVTISPVAAGQFRVFVSVVKLVYKLFPFRHDLLFVEVSNRRRTFREIAVASVLVAAVSMAVGLGGVLFVDLGERVWLWPMVASLGAIVSSLALFPVSADIDGRLLCFYLVGIIVVHVSSYFGLVPFLVALAFLSVAVLLSALVVLRRFLASTFEQKN